jgi:hypothetical protein
MVKRKWESKSRCRVNYLEISAVRIIQGKGFMNGPTKNFTSDSLRTSDLMAKEQYTFQMEES